MTTNRKGTVNERSRKLFARVEKKLRRVGRTRSSAELRRAYATAADAIHKLASR